MAFTLHDLLWQFQLARAAETCLATSLEAARCERSELESRVRDQLALLASGTIVTACGYGYSLDGTTLKKRPAISALDIDLDAPDDTGFPAPDSSEAAEFAAGPHGGRTPAGVPTGTDEFLPVNGVAS